MLTMLFLFHVQVIMPVAVAWELKCGDVQIARIRVMQEEMKTRTSSSSSGVTTTDPVTAAVSPTK